MMLSSDLMRLPTGTSLPTLDPGKSLKVSSGNDSVVILFLINCGIAYGEPDQPDQEVPQVAEAEAHDEIDINPESGRHWSESESEITQELGEEHNYECCGIPFATMISSIIDLLQYCIFERQACFYTKFEVWDDTALTKFEVWDDTALTKFEVWDTALTSGVAGGECDLGKERARSPLKELEAIDQFSATNGVPIPPYFFWPPAGADVGPMIVASGQTYERAFIQRWVDNRLTICRKTRQDLAHANLITNYTVKDLIANWCEDNNIRRCYTANGNNA
ncbi:hypothetical protein IFM89_037227 [Coptis chinensis]|uniref:U-box domain-containing protein n=1 Tax=Coptis chinensis TaxID=261450 RepID=A0A835HBC4_9MAGN|nr:hypothetical protein IFM89_037227 [Coptis chinensis]